MTKLKIFLLSLASLLPLSSVSYASESKSLDLKEQLRDLEAKRNQSGENPNPTLNRAIEELIRRQNQDPKTKGRDKIYAKINSFWRI